MLGLSLFALFGAVAPPAGTPIGMYGTAKGPTAVTPGMKTPVKLTFTGATKWGQ